MSQSRVTVEITTKQGGLYTIVTSDEQAIAFIDEWRSVMPDNAKICIQGAIPHNVDLWFEKGEIGVIRKMEIKV